MKATFPVTDKMKARFGYFLAFIIPFLILLSIFIGREVYPFGDNIYLRSDCYHQYAPFYKELYRKITEGGNLTYSWNIGMGVNFTALYGYYLASPVNLLLGIIAPAGDILLTIDILILVKTGLCGLTCAYYLRNRFNNKSLAFAAVSVFYALSSYMAAFSWNIMWLDCLLLLPLIILGLDRLVDENKYVLYTVTLGISIFSNYYISIMICIYLVVYFAYRMLTSEKTGFKKFYLPRVLTFAKGSLLAGGIGACMILPEIAALSYTVSGEFNFPEQWSNYFSILDMLSRSLMSVEVSIFNAHDPNLYCTVAVFMFVPLYFFCSKINKKERIGTAVLIFFFFICFNMNIPNYIFHGFHFPNSLPARESFIYIFLLVTVVYQTLIHIREFTSKQIYGCFFGGLGTMLLIEELYVSEEYTFDIVYTSMLFLLFYLIIAVALRNNKINRKFMTYVLFIVCIAEATTNSAHEESYKPTGYSSYLQDNEAIENLVAGIEDNDFYRIEKLSRKTKNDAAWNDYKGVSIFSSTANGFFTDYLGSLGFEKSTNAYSYYGSTPFTSALLSVRYVISNKLIEEPYFMTLSDYNEAESRYLYKLDYCLPLGFMLPADFKEAWNYNGNNPFAIQNSFVEAATGYTDMFTQVTAISSGAVTEITTTEDCDLYIYVTNYVDSINWRAMGDDNIPIVSGSASGLNHRQIVHIGDVPANTVLTVSTPDSVSSLQMYAYAFHADVCDLAINALASEGFTVSEYDDTYIKGTITSSTDGLMYTSIIYDRGWTAYIDGKEVEITSINDALLAIPVPEGTHTIELKYWPTNLTLGLVITFVSIALLILFIVLDRRRAKRKMAELEATDEIADDVYADMEIIDESIVVADSNTGTAENSNDTSDTIDSNSVDNDASNNNASDDNTSDNNTNDTDNNSDISDDDNNATAE